MINRSLFSHAIDVFKKILKCTDKDEAAVVCLKEFLKDYEAINEADIDALWIAALPLRNFHLALHFDATFSDNAGYAEECRYILNTVDFDALLEELLNAASAVSNKEEYERRRIEFCKDYEVSLLCVLQTLL